MEKKAFQCIKCGSTQYEADQFQSTGGDLAKIFNVQNKKFFTISCSQCGYTELYKTTTSTGMNILDFFMN